MISKQIVTGALVAVFAASPMMAGAATRSDMQSKAAAKSTKAAAATHATTGTVKTVDATTLVITKAGKKASPMTFTVNPSTHTEGTLAVGSPVSVRYRDEGNAHVAMAITVQKPMATSRKGTAK